MEVCALSSVTSKRRPTARVSAFELVKEAAVAFVADDGFSRGASIAFYIVTSIVPILVIVLSIAGAVYGSQAAQGAVASQLSRVTGWQAADLLEMVIRSASARPAGLVASGLGFLTLVATSSGVFTEMQAALNAIWKVPPKGSMVERLLRGRVASLAIVASLGALLLLSLAISAALAVPDEYINRHFPLGRLVLSMLNLGVSFVLIAILVAAIYKILPDIDLQWHDVLVGAIATALLFEAGNFLIGLYLRSSAIATTYGAAGGLIALLLWIYYSAQIFLFGAEFTKAYATSKGSQRGRPDLMESDGR
jgi:membrane protein